MALPTKTIGYNWRYEITRYAAMIVCHCQHIRKKDIDRAIEWMRASDPEVVITPGKVYRALGKSAECGGCLPLFLSTMRRHPQLPVPVLDVPNRDATVQPRYAKARAGGRPTGAEGDGHHRQECDDEG